MHRLFSFLHKSLSGAGLLEVWLYLVSWLLMCDRNLNASRKCSVQLFVAHFYCIDKYDAGKSIQFPLYLFSYIYMPTQ